MKKVNFDNYTFRCSSLGTLMTGSFGLSETQQVTLDELEDKEGKVIGLTDKQAEQKAKLETAKDTLKGITEKQQGALDELIVKQFAEYILTENQASLKRELIFKRDNPELSETTKTELDKIYIREVHGRRKELSNNYLLKGLGVEDSAIRVLSQVDGELYTKNEDRMKNNFIQGECDIKHHWGDSECGLVIDTKSSWDYWTFRKSQGGIDKGYLFQLNGYGALYGADKLKLSYVLIDTPDSIIDDEIKRAGYKMPLLTEKMFKEVAEHTRKNLTFGDVPIEKRTFSYEFDFDKNIIQSVYDRVPLWREYLNSLDF